MQKGASTSPIGVHLAVTMWTKESFGLFNFRAPPHDTSTRHFHLTKSRLIYADTLSDQIYFQPETLPSPYLDDLRSLIINFHGKECPGNFIAIAKSSFIQSRNLWTPCPSVFRPTDQPVQVNDVFRVGRQTFRFVVVPTERRHLPLHNRPSLDPNSTETLHPHKPSRLPNPSKNSPQKENRSQNAYQILNTNHSKSGVGITTIFCRICLEPETESSPFEGDICFCSSRMPAHVDCIIKWMNKKCEKWNRNGVAYYDLSSLNCDICKQKYPKTISQNGQERQIIDVKYNNSTSYTIIEILENDTDCVTGYYVLNMPSDDRRFLIGRHEQNDISFRDISVSRLHAHIEWRRCRLYVHDHDSKFGTLKLVRDNYALREGSTERFVVDKFAFDLRVFQKGDDCDCFDSGIRACKNPDDSMVVRAMVELKEEPLAKSIEIDDPIIQSAQCALEGQLVVRQPSQDNQVNISILAAALHDDPSDLSPSFGDEEGDGQEGSRGFQRLESVIGDAVSPKTPQRSLPQSLGEVFPASEPQNDQSSCYLIQETTEFRIREVGEDRLDNVLFPPGLESTQLVDFLQGDRLRAFTASPSVQIEGIFD